MSNSFQQTRRGFLGVLGAFVAAAAASKVLPQGVARAKPIKEQIDLMGILKECRVLSVEQECIVEGYVRYRVTYRHDPKGPRTSLDDLVDARTAGLLPIGVMVTQECDAIDVTELGQWNPFWNDRQVAAAKVITALEVTFA